MSTDLLPVWGATGTKIQPDPTKVSVGWLLGEKPPYEFMNWWQSIVTDRLNSILQTGPAPWSATTSYALDALVSRGGIIYRATTPNTNSAPPSANWLAVTQDASALVQGTLNKARLPAVQNATIFEGAAPQVRVSRPDNSVNASVEYRTTAGSVFAGQGAAGVFSIGVTGVLTTAANVRFSVDTATGAMSWSGVAKGDGSEITRLNASNLSAGTVPKDRISGDYEVRNLRITGSLEMQGGLATEADRYVARPGGIDPAFGFVGVAGAGLHMVSTLPGVDIWFDGGARLRVSKTQIAAMNGAVFAGSGADLTSVPATALTGTLQNARLSGDYSFANLVLSGGVTADTLSGRLLAGAGSVANPSIGFSGQDGLGIRRFSEEARFVAGGADIGRWNAAGISVMNAGIFSGNGSGLTQINAGGIATGTLADGRLPATMSPKEFSVSGAAPAATFSRGSGVNIGVEFKGTSGSVVIGQGAAGVFAVASVIGGLSSSPAFTVNPGTGIGWSGAASGDGSGITKLDAGNLNAGTVPNARMTGDYSFANLTLSGRLTSDDVRAGRIILGDGSASAQAIAFAGATGIGLWRSGGSLVIGTGGSASLTIGQTTVTVAAGLVLGGNGADLTNLEASNIATGTLNAARLPATNAARDWVGARISTLPLGAMGSYAMLRNVSSTVHGPDDEIAASNLRYANTDNAYVTSPTPSGTWRCMGNGPTGQASIYLRIA